MKGLFLKDFYCLKQYHRQYCFLLIFFLAIAVAMKSPVYIIFMGFVLGFNMFYTTLTLDESSGFAYLITTPVSRKQIIQEKYGFLLLEMGIILVFSMATGCVVSLISHKSMGTWLPNIIIGVDFYLLVISILIPFVIKWKVEKARIMALAVLLIPTLLIVFVSQFFGDELLDQVMRFLGLSGNGILIFLFSVILLGLSYKISLGIFQKEEY